MLFIVRHASTKKNKKRVDEWSNFPLDLRGVNESKILANWLFSNKIKYGRIYSSDIRRSMQTAKIIARKLQIKVEPLKSLREYRLNYKNPEKLIDMQNRIRKLILSKKFSINKNNIVVTHKGIIREILKYFCQYKDPLRIKIEPAMMVIIDKNKKCEKVAINFSEIKGGLLNRLKV